MAFSRKKIVFEIRSKMVKINAVNDLFLLVQTQGITACNADIDITSCHFGAHCVNASNNFTCICKDGFVGNSLQCQGEPQ